jgi:hypothetical protein
MWLDVNIELKQLQTTTLYWEGVTLHVHGGRAGGRAGV